MHGKLEYFCSLLDYYSFQENTIKGSSLTTFVFHSNPPSPTPFCEIKGFMDF